MYVYYNSNTTTNKKNDGYILKYSPNFSLLYAEDSPVNKYLLIFPPISHRNDSGWFTVLTQKCYLFFPGK